MDKEVEQYFYEKYKKSKIKVVPGHWPNFKTKEEVDKWFKFLKITEKWFE